MHQKFPTYRKYKNNQRFFKIISLNEFEEVSILGSFYGISKLTAKTLPERNLITDLIAEDSPYTDVISALEYESKLKDLEENYKLRAF
jgi:hypothetical protein